jgi:hypothetical protein
MLRIRIEIFMNLYFHFFMKLCHCLLKNNNYDKYYHFYFDFSESLKSFNNKLRMKFLG